MNFPLRTALAAPLLFVMAVFPLLCLISLLIHCFLFLANFFSVHVFTLFPSLLRLSLVLYYLVSEKML